MKKKTTIKEFLAIARKEWREHEDSINHQDDHIPFSEWTSENASSYRKEYGVYYDRSVDAWTYTESNENWQGDDVCCSCGDRYKWEDTETDLCGDCDAIEF